MSQSDAKSRRRWQQFSLRTLLIVVTLMGGLAAVWRIFVEPYRAERAAMAVITELGGSYKTEGDVGWIRYLDKEAQHIVVVSLVLCDKPADYLPHVARLPKLRTLVVGGDQFGDEQLMALRWNKTLRGLVLDSTQATDEGIAKLKEALPDLFVHKSGYRAHNELVSRDIVFNIDSWNLPPLPNPRQAAVPPDWLRHDTGWDFNYAPLFLHAGTKATDADLAHVRHLPSVRVIYSYSERLDGSFLAHVGASSSLTELYLGRTKVSDSTLIHVSQVPRLMLLGLSGTSISDRGLPILADLPWLESLEIQGTLVTDDGLRHLQRCKSLRHLHLGGAKITDKGIPDLARMSQLTTLDLDRTAISREGLKTLRSALPHCDIRYSGAATVAPDTSEPLPPVAPPSPD